MKRYLSVWCPDWPLTRLRRARARHILTAKQTTAAPAPEPVVPFALVEAGAHGLRIAAANSLAKADGVSEALRFTDAKARCPGLISQDIDRAADAVALERLGHWMVRLSPLVALDGLDGLMIETTGCAHLHGGEPAMLDTVQHLLKHQHIPCQVGLASTPGAAHATARLSPGTSLAPGEEKAGLADLPVTALRLSEEAETLLRRFGLTRIGQLYDIDRKALVRRFRSREAVDAVLLRLDQALGQRREPLQPLRAPPAHASRLKCPEPIASSEAIQMGLEQLTDTLCKDLTGLGQGARGYGLLAFRSDGGVEEVSITLARPARDPQHILRLFKEKTDQIDPGFGIDCLVLEARRVGPMETGAVALSGDLAASDTDMTAVAALADRIGAKLGPRAVCVTEFSESHLPERADRLAPFIGGLPRHPGGLPSTGPRPIRVLPRPERVEVLAEVPDGPPQRFVWRRVTRRVVRADGPERINPEWWRHTAAPETARSPDGTDRKWLAPKLDPRADAVLIEAIRADLEVAQDTGPVKALPRARDYYRIEDAEGRRYWVFRQGLYGDGRGGLPDWYVHGLFA